MRIHVPYSSFPCCKKLNGPMDNQLGLDVKAWLTERRGCYHFMAAEFYMYGESITWTWGWLLLNQHKQGYTANISFLNFSESFLIQGLPNMQNSYRKQEVLSETPLDKEKQFIFSFLKESSALCPNPVLLLCEGDTLFCLNAPVFRGKYNLTTIGWINSMV